MTIEVWAGAARWGQVSGRDSWPSPAGLQRLWRTRTLCPAADPQNSPGPIPTGQEKIKTMTLHSETQSFSLTF